ncbi:MAG: NFACT RNA binding domain-containing protein, partial [Lachnospiraceae bacterium]|nr:NFACT RNA binding domain-containing protein [Lachnospiraceae bacterium]
DGINSDISADSMEISELCKLFSCFSKLMTDISNGCFNPCIIYEDSAPKEFSAVTLFEYEQYSGSQEKDSNIVVEKYDSISRVLSDYYAKKASVTRIRQKSSDLRRVLTTLLERNIKKYDIQLKQLKDTEKKDKYKVYGELLTAYGYGIDAGQKSIEVDNYYTGEKLIIPLDEDLTPIENAKKYFDKYGKLKRTEEAVTIQAEETRKEIEHLDSIKTSLDIAVLEEDLIQIKEEMAESGYIKRKGGSKRKEKVTSKPFHYVSSDGFHMYVGKNNMQNEEITFKMANGGDYWFHAKKTPGSHVIVKTEGKELPDRTYEEAAALAAYYSKAKEQEKVEVDYVIRKEVKKPAGSPLGFVVYYTNYSMVIKPDISGIQEIK